MTAASTVESVQTIEATERDTTLNPRQLRSAGFLPATLYGAGLESSQDIQVRGKEFTLLFLKGYREFELTGLSGAPVRVKAQQVQTTGVGQDVLSVEFLKTA